MREIFSRSKEIRLAVKESKTCKCQSNGDTMRCSWCGITVPKSVCRNGATVQSVIGLPGSNLKNGYLRIGKLNLILD